MNAAIPFSNHQASGHEALGGASPVAMNVVVDASGAVRRRPGIATYSGAPTTAIDANGLAGIHITTDGQLFAVGKTPLIGGDRPIYHVTSVSSGLMGLGSPPAGLRGTTRPTFAETQLLLVLAGGETVEKIVLSTLTSDRLGGSPPFATHVVANASRLLLNTYVADKTSVAYSNVFTGAASYAGAEDWVILPNGAGAFVANAKPDPVVGVFENTNAVFTFGSQSLQVFSPDPTLQYAPVSTVEVGCSAPYSVIKRDQEFFWLDHLRRFVKSDGRQITVLSDAVKRTLEEITTISDCFGFRCLIGPVDALVWVFPTDGRAFCLQAGGGWSQWHGYNDATDNWGPITISCAALRTDSTFANLVGTTAGKIGQLSLDTNTDLGTRIRAYVETGYLSRSSDNNKFCRSVKLKFRRGTTTSTNAPIGMFGWRDRPGAWQAQIPVSLGASGDTEPVVEFRSLGTYRTRDWFFEFSGTDDFVLVGATEEFDTLEQ
jgi:hypothetical protein